MTDKNIICTESIDALKGFGIHRIAVAIGVFDGVHAGHRRLLAELQKIASATESTPVVVTFSPHPRQVLKPESAPALLLPSDEKIRRLAENGARAVVTIPFTRTFSQKVPEEFIADCLKCDGIQLCGVCVGKNWRFGAKGAGNSDLLRQLAEKFRFCFSPVAEMELDGEIVSSSSIRAAAAAGDLEKASRFLCAPYAIYGQVVHGENIASRKLDAPTANLHIDAGILPPAGVYAARVQVENALHNAVINIGSAPTFDSYGKQDLLRLEAHLLDTKIDLYDKNIAVIPVRFLRTEQRFSSPDALKEQIRIDIENTLAILTGKDLHHAE